MQHLQQTLLQKQLLDLFNRMHTVQVKIYQHLRTAFNTGLNNPCNDVYKTKMPEID